jgi:hypothetical protein
MELIISFIVVVLGIFAAALSRQLTDEFKAWTPWIIKDHLQMEDTKPREISPFQKHAGGNR